MKKKIAVFVSFIALCTLFIQARKTISKKDRIQGTLVNAHVSAFSRKSLFEKPISAKDMDRWIQAVDGANKFIINNAGRDATLMQASKEISQANNTLSNNIKIINNMGLGNKKIIAPLKKQFMHIQRKMDQLENTLQNKYYFWAKKKEAREIAVTLTQIIGATALKAENDLTKR